MCVGGSTFNSFPDSSDDADEQVWLIEKIVFQFLPGFQKIILRGAHVSRLQATFNSFPDSSDHLVDHRGGGARVLLSIPFRIPGSAAA